MRKNRVVEAIYLRFSFLKRKLECLIAAFIGAVAANNKSIIIHKALNING